MTVDGREVPPGRCPNCRGPMPDHEGGFPSGGGVCTPDGVFVCGAGCVRGWANGEASKAMWAMVAKARGVIAERKGAP